ncbi:ABC-2 type transport system ATP-binding protein [Elusimicrobium simillimum]|uniref:ABC transporter ATP-binding protein n=1 Tax=Elusimicrobium simillimum TaxID=3143438 RepID=UPI003C6ECFB8
MSKLGLIMSTSVTVNNVDKYMKTTLALSGVSTEFKDDTIDGIIGPNGAGKTTLIRLLSSLLTPAKGSIEYTIDGVKMAPAQAKNAIAYFPQEPSLYPDLSCQEHLEFFRDLYSINAQEFKKRSDELYEATSLGRFRDRRAGQLSGGMYKKLGLMCVLLNSPRVLLLDEPTIGVDPVSRRELWDLVNKFSAGNMNVIMSTSYMDEAARCGRVHVLAAGKLITVDTPANIMSKYKLNKFEDIFLRKENDADNAK